MSCYISSNNNRVYVALETAYGTVPAVTAQNRIPTVKLTAKQVLETTGRRDKTGSRTFPGLPNHIRRKTSFQLDTLMTQWDDMTQQPTQGALFQSAMGGAPKLFAGGTAASVAGTNVQFSAAHGLSVGQGLKFGGEIRFVAGIPNGSTVVLNAPFTNLTSGSVMGASITYTLATTIASTSIFDFWDPSTSVQRILNGAAMDTMKIKVNGDYQEFLFGGPAQDLLDNQSFTNGQGGLTAFPAEPVIAGFDYTVIPGHLGQAWLGLPESRFYTLTQAELDFKNNIDLRVREFGSDFARCIAAGKRDVGLNFALLADDQTATLGLYQSARQRSPISVMLQLGQQDGQLFGVYLPEMVPEVPESDDSATRLEWRFQNSKAQGTMNDELYIAFG